MGLMDFLKKELIEIIEFQDDSRDTLSWRFPDDDREIKRGAQLIVRESQIARRFRRHLRARQTSAGDAEYTDSHHAGFVEIRVRVAVQGGHLLRHHSSVHRQQVGHFKPDHAARRGPRRGARAGVWHL